MKAAIIIICVLSLLTTFNCPAQRLDRFGADTGSESRDGFIRRMSYETTISYFGYIKPGTAPDDMRAGKELFFLYFYLQDSVPELGARIIAPVSNLIMPDKGDLVAENYYSNEKDKKNTFNTWIAIERAYSIKSFEEITTKFDKTGWLQLAANDDSGELFNKTNSVIRIHNLFEKPIVPGLYRIVISTTTKDEVKGGYLVQLGFTTILPGVKLTQKVEDLHP